MVRRALLSLMVGTLLALGLQAPAEPAVAAEEVHPEWGSTSAPDAVLKRGCKNYTYSYQVTPPEGQWSLELFFKGPRGKRVASAYFLEGGDPEADTEALQLCKTTTRPGRYTIKAFMSVQHLGETTEGWLPDTYFRLHKRRR